MTDEEVRAREAIRRTQALYNAAGDRGRIAELVGAFTDDGVLEVDQGVFRGKAAIAGFLGGVARTSGGGISGGGISGGGVSGGAGADAGAGARPAGRHFVRHNLTTCHIELTGPATADARTYFLVMTPIGVDHAGVYTDKFVARGPDWLIAYRRVRLDYVSPHTLMAASPAGA